jgi:hypothetical protein
MLIQLIQLQLRPSEISAGRHHHHPGRQSPKAPTAPLQRYYEGKRARTQPERCVLAPSLPFALSIPHVCPSSSRWSQDNRCNGLKTTAS